ncbi:MAG: DNA internalization-related competence protein ComEC/Rec2 [Pseudomonadales bacterium]
MFSWMMAMLLGIVSASFLPISLSNLDRFFWLVTVLPILITALLYNFLQRCPLRVPSVMYSLGVLVGVFYAYGISQSVLLAEHEGELIELEGVVTALPRTERRYGKALQRFELDVTSTRWPLSKRPMRRVKLSWSTDLRPRAGEHWRLRAKLKRPRGFANPGGSDYQLHLLLNRIDATGYVKWGEQVDADRVMPSSWQTQHALLNGRLSMLRESLGEKLAQQTIGLKNARFIRALAIGDGAALNSADWTLLNETGTTHLFVISGLHVGMLATLVYALVLQVAKLLAPLRPATTAQRWAAYASVCAALAYAALAGFSLPTQRAVFMFAMFMLARSNGFRLPLAGVLSAAALVIAIGAPLSVRSSGFWLSFIAVGALLFVHAHRLGAVSNRLWLAARVQIACTVALTPMLLLFFQSSSLVMPAVNLLVVPLVAVCIVPATLCVLAIVALGVSAPELFLQVLDWLISFTWDVLEYFASSVKNNSSLVYSPGTLGFLGLALASGLFLAPPALRRHALFVLPLCYLPAVSTAMSGAQQANGCDKAAFAILDVGQGLSAVFSAYGRTMVYDVGAKYSDSFDLGSAVVAPYLRSKGRYEVDLLVLSHEDNDHAGGLKGLQRLMPVKEIVASFEVAQYSAVSPQPLLHTLAQPLTEHRLCKAGASWHWDDIRFEFLAPTAEGLRDFSKSNNRSCVLKISAPGFSVLLPGDIEADAEKALINRIGESDKLSADIVVMPHHGSKSSSGDAFVTATNAQFAIASAAYKGRFGHPHAEVLGRFLELGTSVLNTAQMGAIEFDLPICSTTARMKPKGFRQHWGNYWLGW